MDYVTVGGCRQYGNYDTSVNPWDSKKIWERAVEFYPPLKNAQVVREAVGLRPNRTIVRLEKEMLGGGSVVVHHYGHCGGGVATSPGTAVTAVQLVKEALRGDVVNHHLANAKL